MRRARLVLLLCFLNAAFLPARKAPAAGPEGSRSGEPAQAAYRLDFTIRGGAISRVLLLFPLRIFYEASAAVDLQACRREDGSTGFAFAGLSRPAYVMRTLGFGGKTLALLVVDGGDGDGGAEVFSGELLARWRKQAPEFAAKAARFKNFPHRLPAAGPRHFSFQRDVSGAYREIVAELEPVYRHHPARTGCYFNVFPMLAHLLTLLNQRFMPATDGREPPTALLAEWNGEDLDLSAALNHLAGLMEKVVRAHVTVEQKSPFRLLFYVAAAGDGELEICGEAFPDVPLWKGFMIREMFRRLRLRPADGELLSDEIWLGLRSKNGQGGFGRLRLERISPREDKR
jgi:hypothetical protein